MISTLLRANEIEVLEPPCRDISSLVHRCFSAHVRGSGTQFLAGRNVEHARNLAVLRAYEECKLRSARARARAVHAARLWPINTGRGKCFPSLSRCCPKMCPVFGSGENAFRSPDSCRNIQLSIEGVFFLRIALLRV